MFTGFVVLTSLVLVAEDFFWKKGGKKVLKKKIEEIDQGKKVE